MSDTPETDAQLKTFTSISKLNKRFENKTGTVNAEFARKLEKERNKFRMVLRKISKLDTSQLAPDVQCSAIYLAMDALGDFK